MIVGIHHTAISVPDMDAAFAFYCDVLGFEKLSDGGWEPGNPVTDAIVGLRDSAARGAMLKGPNAYIELFEYKQPAGAKKDPNHSVADHGYTHFCLQVTDINAEYERLMEGGMTFHCPPQDMGATWATYGRDPFGNVIEIYEILDPDVPQLPPKA
ncbi:MAG: VOC family protein [Alphaproteobacteria bacterium]